jgi:lipoprotein-anchoring transpeptidase ErfK/SrfK
VCADTNLPFAPSYKSFGFNGMPLAQGVHFLRLQAIGDQEEVMKALTHNGLAMAAMALVLTVSAATQSTNPRSTAKAPAAAQRVATAQAEAPKETKIVVSLEDHKLALVEDGKVVKVYPVAVGKPSTPSPVGTFTIQRRVMNPTYSHDGRTVPPGPHNPVGSRWMGLSIHGYGIHGTNEPNSIGKAASHGCIRMAKADLEELYPQVSVGDTVELVGQRNEDTAEIFGGAGVRAPASAQDATQLAKASAPDATTQVHPATESATASAAPVKAPSDGLAAGSGVAVTGAF